MIPDEPRARNRCHISSKQENCKEIDSYAHSDITSVPVEGLSMNVKSIIKCSCVNVSPKVFGDTIPFTVCTNPLDSL